MPLTCLNGYMKKLRLPCFKICVSVLKKFAMNLLKVNISIIPIFYLWHFSLSASMYRFNNFMGESKLLSLQKVSVQAISCTDRTRHTWLIVHGVLAS